MRLIRFSECVVNLDNLAYINIYDQREVPLLQLVFATGDFVALEKPEDVSKMRQIITGEAR